MNDLEAMGPNSWFVDEMRSKFAVDANSVPKPWRDFFATETPDSAPRTPTADVAASETAGPSTNGSPAGQPAAPQPPPPPPELRPPPPAVVVSEPTPPATVEPEVEPESEPEPRALRGAAARIVTNMEASLGVPTATSFREVPARLLEVNRSIINGYLGRTRGGKVSFTHLIGYAVVRAVADHIPAMNSSFIAPEDGEPPKVLRHTHVGLGIAVDIEKSDGSRTLMVPCIKNADTLDFRAFVEEYERIITKVRENKLSPDDFSDLTVTLTNPGTIGTSQSVPRLMPGQGLIVGVGAINYPTEFQAANPQMLAELGVSKVIALSSTYDHRVIQGAESGMFLQKMHDLLLGNDGFYDDALATIGVPYEAVKWRVDHRPIDRETAMLEKQSQVDGLIHMYRVRGHLIADLDPLGLQEVQMHSELDPATYGLTIWDLEREFLTTGLAGNEEVDGSGGARMKLGEILRTMRDAYCRTIGVEYMHVQDLQEKQWIQHCLEGVDITLDPAEKLHVLDRLSAAEALERFLGTKYVGQKRFGIEGAESAIPILDAIIGGAADAGLESVVMGMAHRGRLNVLVNIVGKEFEKLFSEFEAPIESDSIQGGGDVKYHLGQSGVFTSRTGNTIGLTLAANPSHLEAVDPVVAGMARARMDSIDTDTGYGPYPVLPLTIHGDAAFAGQGVVAETLAMSQIHGYKVGGTVHLVINNQVGFTTSPEASRSSTYATDVARTVQAPIFHVNGDDPESCVRVAKLAFEYRQRFNKDVVVDMWCYRRHGHNEGDDPSYTQPLMYRRIDKHPSTRERYVAAMVKAGELTPEDAEAAQSAFRDALQLALDSTRNSAPPPGLIAKAPPLPVGVLPPAETAVTQAALDTAFEPLFLAPDDEFVIHPKLAKQFAKRETMYREDRTVDWALAEALAFGTMLAEGTSIRLSGQDSRRGTFSHRHSTLVCYETAREHSPLTTLCADESTRLWAYDSLLSEYAALGFEYGYSVVNPDVLVIWEAQFGDFVNGAQIIIDQFITGGEDKWNQNSGLVMLLPHGYEGQGPEHSSGRIERFLLASAEDNIQVVNCTTAAQMFHVLRRQMHRGVRKPLVLFTPKSLLRARQTQSSVDALTNGTFREVLDDTVVDPASAQRVVFTTGKIGPELEAARAEDGAEVAIVRVEQLYPWPAEQIAEVLARYPNTNEIVWLQEEPENMGAWNYVKGRFYEAHGDSHSIQRMSRYESGSPATGSNKIHAQEQQQLLDQALSFD